MTRQTSEKDSKNPWVLNHNPDASPLACSCKEHIGKLERLNKPIVDLNASEINVDIWG